MSSLGQESKSTYCPDDFKIINKDGDREHQRGWQNAGASRSFCREYSTQEQVSASARLDRQTTFNRVTGNENFWGQVYADLANRNSPSLQFLVDTLSALSSSLQFGPMETANMLVSFVQDIPYSYVLNKPCAEAENKSLPCIENETLGILSPYEFIHTLRGDCDTRAVLLYALMREMGMDPMIVTSDEYAHAMLALNIPAYGDYLEHRGKKYYFWETTAQGWAIGMLPPSTGNINYWKIALVNEL